MNQIIKLIGVGLMLNLGTSVSADKYDDALSGEWTVFGAIPSFCQLSEETLTSFKTIPAEITDGDAAYDARVITISDQQFDIGKFLYPTDTSYDPSRCGDGLYLMKEITCDEPVELVVGAGSDWWMEWFVNGEPVFDTLQTGNVAHEFSCVDNPFHMKLNKGKNLICVLVKSGSGGWKFATSCHSKYTKQLLEVELRRKNATEEADCVARALITQAEKASNMKLAVFGSSVAFGAGATNMFGWGNQLGKLLEKENWTYVNKSVGGDNTIKILARFEQDLLPEKPDMVIIGLSLANEGIMGNSPLIYNQFVKNMRKIIQLCRRNNIIPIVANCYPNNSYGGKHYTYIKKFNEELNRWNIASIDFMGSVNEGNGHWQADAWVDAGHPNDFGHTEMFYSIPPSLFDNLIDWNYPLPASKDSWMECGDDGDKSAALQYQPEYTMHSFSMAFTVKLLKNYAKKVKTIAAVDDCKILVGESGCWELDVNGTNIVSDIKVTQGTTYNIGLTHSYCNSEVKFYVNGKDIGSVPSRMVPKTFYMAGGKSFSCSQALFKDVLVYRSCLDADSMESLNQGQWLRSSLEVYAPLNDAIVGKGVPLINMAQTGAEVVPKSYNCKLSTK